MSEYAAIIELPDGYTSLAFAWGFRHWIVSEPMGVKRWISEHLASCMPEAHSSLFSISWFVGQFDSDVMHEHGAFIAGSMSLLLCRLEQLPEFHGFGPLKSVLFLSNEMFKSCQKSLVGSNY